MLEQKDILIILGIGILVVVALYILLRKPCVSTVENFDEKFEYNRPGGSSFKNILQGELIILTNPVGFIEGDRPDKVVHHKWPKVVSIGNCTGYSEDNKFVDKNKNKCNAYTIDRTTCLCPKTS